jgi:hypothetical protein
MTTDTFFATGDGNVESNSTVYSTARAGNNLVTATALRVGQTLAGSSYYVEETFIRFDTSSIPDSAVISSVVLSLWCIVDNSTTNFVAEARSDDWGTTLETTDWVAGADLASKTLLATFAISGITVGAYNAFTESGTDFQSAINKTGETRFLVSSDRTRTNTTPTDDEYVAFRNQAFAGTTQDPKLVVTYSTVRESDIAGGADGLSLPTSGALAVASIEA